MVTGFGLFAADVGVGYVWGSAVAAIGVETGVGEGLTPLATPPAMVWTLAAEEVETTEDAEVSGVWTGATDVFDVDIVAADDPADAAGAGLTPH